MKKLITSRIFSFILGAIIFSGVTVFAYSLSSKDIKFTPADSEWQVENVEDAINELYSNYYVSNKNNTNIFMAYKKSADWNSAGFSINVLNNSEYMTSSSSTVIIKKSGLYKVTYALYNTGATNSVPKYKLYKNNLVVAELAGSTVASNYKTSSMTIEFNENDILKAEMLGGANNATVYITVFEYLGA